MEITGANDHVRIVAADASRKVWDSFREDLPGLLELISAMDKGET